jgi:hypothetical protein
MSERAVFVTGGIGFIGNMKLLVKVCDPHLAAHHFSVVEDHESCE